MEQTPIFSLNKISERVYHIKFDKHYDLAMAFLRFQEYYESPNSRFQNHNFTISEYLSWYNKEYGTQYHEDWAGFNLPVSKIIELFPKIVDINHYDHLMFGIAKLIESYEPRSYLIGCAEFDESTMKHELTHALYYTNEDYKFAVSEVLKETDYSLFSKMRRIISEVGYAFSSIEDEINAYLTTGDYNGYFDEYIDDEKYNELKGRLINLHKEYYKF